MTDKADIVLTMTVSEKGSKLVVVVSGAPQHEMPTVRSGVFADRHRLLDEVWVELKKRKPQVVKVPKEKTDKSTKPAADTTTEPGDQLVAEEPDQAPDPVEKALDDAGANLEPEIPDPDETEEQLPLIEGDPTNG